MDTIFVNNHKIKHTVKLDGLINVACVDKMETHFSRGVVPSESTKQSTPLPFVSDKITVFKSSFLVSIILAFFLIRKNKKTYQYLHANLEDNSTLHLMRL